MGPQSSSERHQIVKNSFRYFSATLFGQIVGLVRSVLIPVLLIPTQLGVWNLMNVVVGYGGNAHLGILHGMNKLIPMLRGRGASTEVEQIKDSAFWVNVLLNAGWFVFVWMALYAVPSAYSSALRITSVIVFLQGMYSYYFSLLRADSRFKLVSVGVGGLSILSTIFVLGFGWFCADRLSGALIGLAVTYGLIVLFWSLASRYHFAFHVSRGAVRRSFEMGIPLTILGVVDSLFISIDRWVIVSYMGATVLGYYALGIMASNLIGLVPGSIANVLYPKMLERFGASGSEVALRGLMVGPIRAMAAVISLLIGGAVLILPLLIRFFVPKYLPSVSLFGILISAAFFYASATIPGSFLVAINKQKILIKIQIVAILLALTLDVGVVNMGWGIVGIAWSTAFAYAVYGCGYMVTAAYYAFDRRSDMVNFLVEIYGLFVAMLLGLILSTALIPAGKTIGIALIYTSLRLVLFLVILLPVLWWSNRHTGLLAIVREMFPAYFNKLRGRTL